MKWPMFLLLENGGEKRGFRVHWEMREGGMLRSDSTPDKGEVPIRSETEAWEVATRVANALPNAVNVYVIFADNFVPVPGYESQIIRRYPGDRPTAGGVTSVGRLKVPIACLQELETIFGTNDWYSIVDMVKLFVPAED